MISIKKPAALAWALGLALCALTAVSVLIAARGAAPETGGPADARGPADTFLMARMPEITTQYESGIETMKQRIDEWLAALTAAGFHPLLLSDALRRLEQGSGLPDQSVVVFFSPGYRKTFETVAPLFAKNHCPAVWITDRAAMKRCDRRYLTFHATRTMKARGGYDIGFMEKGERGGFSVDGARLAWSPVAGAFALNRLDGSGRLNYLSVNAAWSAEELVNRLRAEAIAVDKTCLSKALIHGKEWGVPLRGAPSAAGSFDLRPAIDQRRARLFWLSTLGRGDFHLRMSVASLVGELCLQLRYDEYTGDTVQLIVSGSTIFVEQQSGSRAERLLTIPLRTPAGARPMAVGVTMKGRFMAVYVDNVRFPVSSPVSIPAGRGMVQLCVTDRIRGSARADGVRMTFSPLGEPAT